MRDMPQSPNLQKLAVDLNSIAEIIGLLFSFLRRNSTLVELCWKPDISDPILSAVLNPFPDLPSLKILWHTSTSFVHSLLSEHSPGSIQLESLGSLHAASSEFERDFALLRNINSNTLLRLELSSINTLNEMRAISYNFPALEQIYLQPIITGQHDVIMQEIRAASWQVLSLGLNRRISRRTRWDLNPLHTAIQIFPNLRSVWNVDAGDEALAVRASFPEHEIPQRPPSGARKTVAKIRRAYPQLRVVNGWSLDA